MDRRAARVLFCLAAATGVVWLRAAEEVVSLPPVWVTAARMESFYLASSEGKIPRKGIYGTRVWFKSAAPPMANMYFGFRAERVKDGDEIITIGGREAAEMKPGEAVQLILHVFSGHGTSELTLQVQRQGEKDLRTVILDRFWSRSAKTAPQKSQKQ